MLPNSKRSFGYNSSTVFESTRIIEFNYIYLNLIASYIDGASRLCQNVNFNLILSGNQCTIKQCCVLTSYLLIAPTVSQLHVESILNIPIKCFNREIMTAIQHRTSSPGKTTAAIITNIHTRIVLLTTETKRSLWQCFPTAAGCILIKSSKFPDAT